MRQRRGQALKRTSLSLLVATLVALGGAPGVVAQSSPKPAPSSGRAAQSSAQAAQGSGQQDPDLGYAKAIGWHLDGLPEISAMEGTIHEILKRSHVAYPGIDGTPLDSFAPGLNYSLVYIRDAATHLPMSRYYYGVLTVRSTIEEFLRSQYPDGAISATVGFEHKVDKATVVSDEETSAVLYAVEAYDTLPDPAWLKQPLRGQTLVERLNAAMSWALTYRRDPDTGLIKRAHTTDWGDIKWEPGDPSDMQPGDQWTISIYDQSIAYAALQGLARLNAAVGRDPDSARWQGVANELRASTNAALWMNEPQRGYYRIHRHLAPDHAQHEESDDDVIAIGNAAAIYYGLAEPDKVPRILNALQRAQDTAGAVKPGLSLDPPYSNWQQAQAAPHIYQNGALWDWWAGRQVSAEFWSGYWHHAREHLLEIARDWASHPAQVREWESPWTGRTSADQEYLGGATAVGQAVVEGLYGVQIIGKEVRLSPRLMDLDGGVRLYVPSSDLYVAYEYSPDDLSESVRYGTNSPQAISVRLPVRWRAETAARLDGKDLLPVMYERVGEMLIGTVIVPSGQHRVDFRALPPGRAKF